MRGRNAAADHHYHSLYHCHCHCHCRYHHHCYCQHHDHYRYLYGAHRLLSLVCALVDFVKDVELSLVAAPAAPLPERAALAAVKQ
jgi:hypothetical protein